MSDSSHDQTFNVLVLAPSYPPAFRAGGPARTLEALVKAAPEKFHSWVIAPNRDLGSTEDLDVPVDSWNSVGKVSTKYIREHRLFQAFRQIRSTKDLRPQLVYVNSFSHPVFALMPYILFAAGTWPKAKLVVAPRGEMDPNALRVRGTVKKFIIWLLKATGFAKNMNWHASNEREGIHITNVWGPNTSIIIREDETSLPQTAEPPMPHSGILRLGFVSRIVPNKGLFEAIQAVLTLNKPVEFEIFGPEEDPEYADKCHALAETAQGYCKINFNGPIHHETVREVFRRFDVFVFPTYFENFSHVIAESLSVSCPVVAPDTTPWTDTLARGGGKIIDTAQNSLNEILLEISEYSPTEIDELKTKAAFAYNDWRSKRNSNHIFNLVLSENTKGS